MVPFPRFPSSLKFMDANFRVQILISRNRGFSTTAQLYLVGLTGSKSVIEWGGQSGKLIRILLADDIHTDLASES